VDTTINDMRTKYESLDVSAAMIAIFAVVVLAASAVKGCA